MFILGHPIHRFSEEVAAQADALADAAREQGLRVNMWKDGWLKGSAVGAKPEDLLGRNAVFVQPLAAGEASDHVAEVGKTQRQLARLGIQNARVVLWLPSEQSDPEFEAHAISDKDLPPLQEAWPGPALRIDPSNELAARLRTVFKSTQAHDDPVLQIETVGSPSGARPDPNAKRLSDELARLFWDIVRDVVPTEPSSPWHFWNEQFKAQIANLPGSRTIVAIHDLDVAPSPDRVVNRKRIELKFQQMQDFVLQSSDAGKLKVFWAALLLKNADALPFAKYPFDARYKDWRLLSFERSDESLTSGQPVRPDPASLGVFRSELSAWGAQAG